MPTPNPAAVAYHGAAMQSALALKLPMNLMSEGSKAIEALTSALPMIEGLDKITGIGIGGGVHVADGASVSPSGHGGKGNSNQR